MLLWEAAELSFLDMCRIFLVKVLSILTLNLALYWEWGWTEQLLEVSSILWELMVLSDRNLGLWGWQFVWRGCLVFLWSSYRLYCSWFLTQLNRVRVSEWRTGVKIAWLCVTPAMLVYLASVVKFSFVLCIGVKMKTGTSVCNHPSVSHEGRTR